MVSVGATLVDKIGLLSPFWNQYPCSKDLIHIHSRSSGWPPESNLSYLRIGEALGDTVISVTVSRDCVESPNN